MQVEIYTVEESATEIQISKNCSSSKNRVGEIPDELWKKYVASRKREYNLRQKIVELVKHQNC